MKYILTHGKFTILKRYINELPSGKRLHKSGKSQLFMGKTTINGNFQLSFGWETPGSSERLLLEKRIHWEYWIPQTLLLSLLPNHLKINSYVQISNLIIGFPMKHGGSFQFVMQTFTRG